MPGAKDELLHYISDTVRAAVRREVLDPERHAGDLYEAYTPLDQAASHQTTSPVGARLVVVQTVQALCGGRLAAEVQHFYCHAV